MLNPLQSLWTGDTGTTQSARAAFRHRSLPCRAPPVRFAEPDTTWWCPLPEQRHNQNRCPCLAGAPHHGFSLNYQSLICQKSSAVPGGGLAGFFFFVPLPALELLARNTRRTHNPQDPQPPGGRWWEPCVGCPPGAAGSFAKRGVASAGGRFEQRSSNKERQGWAAGGQRAAAAAAGRARVAAGCPRPDASWLSSGAGR